MNKLANSDFVGYNMKALADDVKWQWGKAKENAGKAHSFDSEA